MTVGLAGRCRRTGDERLEVRESIGVRRCQNAGCVEPRGTTGDEQAELAGVVVEPRGNGAGLAADVAREASDGEEARSSEQTGERRGIGILRVR